MPDPILAQLLREVAEDRTMDVLEEIAEKGDMDHDSSILFNIAAKLRRVVSVGLFGKDDDSVDLSRVTLDDLKSAYDDVLAESNQRDLDRIIDMAAVIGGGYRAGEDQYSNDDIAQWSVHQAIAIIEAAERIVK